MADSVCFCDGGGEGEREERGSSWPAPPLPLPSLPSPSLLLSCMNKSCAILLCCPIVSSALAASCISCCCSSPCLSSSFSASCVSCLSQGWGAGRTRRRSWRRRRRTKEGKVRSLSFPLLPAAIAAHSLPPHHLRSFFLPILLHCPREEGGEHCCLTVLFFACLFIFNPLFWPSYSQMPALLALSLPYPVCLSLSLSLLFSCLNSAGRAHCLTLLAHWGEVMSCLPVLLFQVD